MDIITGLFGLVTKQRELNKYLKLQKEKEELDIEFDNLIIENSRISKALECSIGHISDRISRKEGDQEQNDLIKSKINDRYNDFVSGYIEKIAIIKNKKEAIKNKEQELFKNNPELEKSIKIKENIDKNIFKYENYLDKSLNYKRSQMPQISKDNIHTFLSNFEDSEIKVNTENKALKDLIPSQGEFNKEKIKNFLAKEIEHPILISNDNYILDGHHNWAANLEKDEKGSCIVHKIDLPIKKLIDKANKVNITKKKDINDKVIKMIPSEYEETLITLSKSIENKLIKQDKVDQIKAHLKGFVKGIYLDENGISGVYYEKIEK